MSGLKRYIAERGGGDVTYDPKGGNMTTDLNATLKITMKVADWQQLLTELEAVKGEAVAIFRKILEDVMRKVP